MSSGVSLDDITGIYEFLEKQLDGMPAIIGASSGIDSSLVAMLASRSLPKDSVKIFFMPDSLTPEADYEDISKLSGATGINIHTINIQAIADAFTSVLNAVDPRAIGNIKSRIRMVILYYQANLAGGLVIGTTNRTESLIGYYTKHGDGACDIEPIIHLYKHQVKEMASLVGVPESIIEKKPSAGLWESQTDEEELGIPYDRLDRILEDLFDSGKGVLTDEHRRIKGMYENSIHKRRMPVSIEDDV